MKSKLLFVLALILLLFVLMIQNNKFVRNLALEFVNPLKKDYKHFSNKVESAGHTYLFQKETIKRLQKENRKLRNYLFDQSHYLRQLSVVFNKLPYLSKLPYKSIVLVDTISYVKLNKLDTILLTMPKKVKLKEGKTYGLIQDEVVAGTARVDHGNLYGFLTSSSECMFGVFVGPKRIPGVAKGIDKNIMEVDFIPKWANVKNGDIVETSGLDNIFFANVPVGEVTKVVEEGSYKKLYIKTYADTIHPNLFFLITDPKPYLVSVYDQNKTNLDDEYEFEDQKPVSNDKNLSSIPVMIQTKDLEIDPSEFEIPHEEAPKRPKIVAPTKPKKIKPKPVEKKPVTIKKSVTVKKPTDIKSKPSVDAVNKEQNKQKKKPKKTQKKKRPSPFDILRVGF